MMNYQDQQLWRSGKSSDGPQLKERYTSSFHMMEQVKKKVSVEPLDQPAHVSVEEVRLQILLLPFIGFNNPDSSLLPGSSISFNNLFTTGTGLT